MPTDRLERPLTLSEALLQWATPALVERVRAEERRLLASHVRDFYQVADSRWRLCDETELRQPTRDSWLEHASYGQLVEAWQALERDFRFHLERGEFHLLGIRSGPDGGTNRSLIPGLWAADMQFKFPSNAVEIRGSRYIALQALPGPEPCVEKASDIGAAPGRADGQVAVITAENARSLTDDQVIVLLEEYARRIVEDPGTKLTMPVKVSFMPIIKRKMRHRFEIGEAHGTLKAEANALAEWIKGVVVSHQVPGASHIENEVRVEYAKLKAASKGRI